MRNFVILFVVTATIGIFLKIYFPTSTNVENNETLIILNENIIDSLLYKDMETKKQFDDYYVYNLNKLEKLFKSSPYDTLNSRYYALGNVYYKRYFEYIAARDLLCEINNNLFNEPAMDRFSLPLIVSYEDNEQLKNLFNDYIFNVRKKYGLNKLINSSEIKKPRSSYEFDELSTSFTNVIISRILIIPSKLISPIFVFKQIANSVTTAL